MLVSHLFDQDKLKLAATRDGYGDGLVVLGKRNSRVVVLSADLTESTRSQEFKEQFPQRFFELGVAEQNMMGVAAGLAIEGFIPFVSSYAAFSPGRSWDQLRVSVCYSNSNVKIAGAHTGLSVGPDGATHQALEDIAITRVLPNLVVLAPADAVETKKATIAAAKHVGPVYLRFARAKTPVFTTSKTPFTIGKALTLRRGSDVSIVSCGPLTYEALVAAEQLQHVGIAAEVIHSPSIKPLDVSTIARSAKKTGAVVTVEEHQIAGGLGGVVAEALAQRQPTPIEFVGMRDSFGESGDPDRLLKKYKLNAAGIMAAVKKVIKKK